MSTQTYQILASKIELAKKTINYYLAQVINLEMFEEIKRIGPYQNNHLPSNAS